MEDDDDNDNEANGDDVHIGDDNEDISGKPRCTGVWAWGENHGRAVELYRESIEATQVVVVMMVKMLLVLMIN